MNETKVVVVAAAAVAQRLFAHLLISDVSSR